MDYLKDFLKQLTKTKKYYAEMVGNAVEIFVDGEPDPVVLLEFDGSYYNINLRCDLFSQVAAQIVYDMTVIDEDIQIGPDFYKSTDHGIVYGQQAFALHFADIINAVDKAQEMHGNQLNNATFVVQQPIYGYGNKDEKRKSKMQRLWGDDLE